MSTDEDQMWKRVMGRIEGRLSAEGLYEAMRILLHEGRGVQVQVDRIAPGEFAVRLVGRKISIPTGTADR